jgi:hypothetical protein
MSERAATQKADSASALATSSGFLQRKCECGNGTVAGGECQGCATMNLQRKLSVGASDDPLELEADRVADQVMAASNPRVDATAPPQVSRFSRQSNTQMDAAPTSVERVVSVASRPLDPALREDMEQRFARDFSQVRIHTGTNAERSASDVNANAYTVGQQIVFGRGQFAPGTRNGRRLIAHELTHVLQQEGSLGRSGGEPAAGAVVHRDSRRQAPDTTKKPPKKAGAPAKDSTSSGRPTWEEALATMNAITAMLPHVEDFGIVLPTFGTSNGIPADASLPGVPKRYQALVRDWDFIVHPVRKGRGSVEISIGGTMREGYLDRAEAETQPLVNELATEGEASSTDPYLASYWKSLARLRGEIAEEVVSEAANKAKTDKGAGFETLTEEEKAKTLVEKALGDVHLAIKVATQFEQEAIHHAVHDAEHLAKMKKLDELFHEAAKQAGEFPHGGALEAASHMSLAAALVHVEGGLHGLSAILAVSDPAKREEMFRARSGIFGRIGVVTQVVKLAIQFAAGATALTSAGAYAVAKALGKEGLAAEILAKGIPALEMLDKVISAVLVVHGVLTLLDSDATGEEKEDAILDIGVGGATLLGRFVAAFEGGPATLAVVISFFTFKALAHAAVNFSVDLVKISLNQCYPFMRRQATDVNDDALRLAIALQMATYEPDPHRRALFKQAADTFRSRLSFDLADAIRSATVVAGARDKDPAAHDPLLRRFLPLAKKPRATDLDMLTVAKDYVHTVAEALAHPQEILDEEVDYVWKHYG